MDKVPVDNREHDDSDPIIAAVREAQADGTLTPTGTRSSKARPITVNGRTYSGIGSIPWPDLIAVSRASLLAQGYSPESAGALLAHRTRRIQRAVHDGTFTPAQVAALGDAGVI
jgi:hypothetical protein